MEKKLIGRISHYYGKIGVAVVDLIDEIKIGDEVSIEGKTTNFTQKVESMEIEHKAVTSAKAGDSIGLKVISRVRERDNVYKLVKE